MSDFVDFPPIRSRKFLHLHDELDVSLAAYIVVQKRPVVSFETHLLNTKETDHEKVRLFNHQDFYSSEYAFEVDQIIEAMRPILCLTDNQIVKGKFIRPKILTTEFVIWCFKRNLLDNNEMLLEEHFKFWFLNAEVITLDKDGITVISEFIRRGEMKLSELKIFLGQNEINGFPESPNEKNSESYKIEFVLPKSLKSTNLISKVKSMKGYYEINRKAEIFRPFNHGRSGRHLEMGNL